jgi:hypothetical protein
MENGEFYLASTSWKRGLVFGGGGGGEGAVI